VHRIDADAVIEEYRVKGFELVERTKPTIIAQAGFERLVFARAETAEAIASLAESQAPRLSLDQAVRVLGFGRRRNSAG